MDASLPPDGCLSLPSAWSPQQVRLALIEGAIRFGEQAEAAWESGRHEAASDAIGRCRRIVDELLREIPADQSPLCRQIERVYLFLLESLVRIQIGRNVAELERVLAVLREEQETWRQVCGNLTSPATSEPTDRDVRRAA